MHYNDDNNKQNIRTGLKNLIYICSKIFKSKKNFFFEILKISRHKSIYSCLNSTNIRARRDILSNSIYLNNKINSNKPYSINLKNLKILIIDIVHLAFTIKYHIFNGKEKLMIIIIGIIQIIINHYILIL